MTNYHLLHRSDFESRAEGVTDECAALERLANHLKGFGSAAQGTLPLGEA